MVPMFAVAMATTPRSGSRCQAREVCRRTLGSARGKIANKVEGKDGDKSLVNVTHLVHSVKLALAQSPRIHSAAFSAWMRVLS